MPAQKLHLDNENDSRARALESNYESWQRDRKAKAEKDFLEMLGENAFVEFWGRLRKMQEEGDRKGAQGMNVEVAADDLAGEEGDAEKVDLKTLAKNIDVREIERVLKVN